ncbi:MAG: bifunctional D-glycero-beta-D-manno-heptose-7-phosphate kinase/D-glycero-beta-D-manno-heptose 1-phosphate adenylyltransferase HldE [Pontibacterium sp.]
MKLTLPRFDKGRVLVVGDVMLDKYWHGDTGRISPEAPVPVVKVGQKEGRPGGAANVALNIRALGAPVSLVGLIGNDEAGRELDAQLSSAGVHCEWVVAKEEPTITKLRVLSRHQQLIRLDFEEPFAADYGTELSEKMQNLLDMSDVVVFSDYGKGTLAQVEGLIKAARAAGKQVLVDPKGSDFSRYAGATLLTPNLSEFEAIVGKCEHEQEIIDCGLELARSLSLDALLVTRSENGMSLIPTEDRPLHFPTRAREVFDVTGAGDTVISTLAAALAAKVPMPEAVALSNIAAGIVVAKLGTAAISAPELGRELINDQQVELGVVTEEQLDIALAHARAAGEKIVFTNGCFDILHAGHVGYLEQARASGDRLVLAVNSDESVKRLKGEGRPVNPVERRMTVLAALASVDWVVPFGEDTPERLIKKVKPDVLVKGGDYSVDTVVGADFVQSYGGKVELMAFLDACSTTLIVDKIKSNNGSEEGSL